jgi:hypothetical protein
MIVSVANAGAFSALLSDDREDMASLYDYTRALSAVAHVAARNGAK